MEKLAGQKVLEALEARFQAFEASLNGHTKAEAHAIRKSAFDQLMKLGLPNAKHEEYKFTNLTKVLEKNVHFGIPSPTTTSVDATQFAIKDLEAYQLVFVNGVLNSDLSDDISVSGVTIKALSEDMYEANSLFNKTVTDSDDSFVAMNTAFANNGIAIEVADKVILDKPIMLQYAGNQEDYSVRNLSILANSQKEPSLKSSIL